MFQLTGNLHCVGCSLNCEAIAVASGFLQFCTHPSARCNPSQNICVCPVETITSEVPNMTRAILLTLTLLFSAFWLAAGQNYPSQTTPGGQSSGQSSNGQTTVEGCLSSSNGNYSLTDKAGNTYQLSGDSAQLSHHVGHEVQVTGTLASTTGSTGHATSTQSSTEGTATTGAQIMQVTSFQHISNSCSTGR